MTFADIGIDPEPITAWAVLALTGMGIVTGVVAAIAALWRWVALPQIEHLVDARVSEVEQTTSAQVRRIHARIDNLLIAKE